MTTIGISRRVREKEEIQRRILDAARELFAAEGYEAVTMKKIADRIEYTPTALYFHFQDKQDLFRRLCAEDFGKLAARFQVLARVPDPLERLRMLARGYVAFALEHPNPYRLMFLNPPPETTEEGDHPDTGAYAPLRRAASEAAARGHLRPEFNDPELVAQTLWAGLHGVAALAITTRNDAGIDWRPVEARTEAMIEALLKGLARGT
jgi:AcrR family transcriptional regulator